MEYTARRPTWALSLGVDNHYYSRADDLDGVVAGPTTTTTTGGSAPGRVLYLGRPRAALAQPGSLLSIRIIYFKNIGVEK
ncbi:MAG: hypothetical protein WKG07_24195 [Hymenobacter sp.]